MLTVSDWRSDILSENAWFTFCHAGRIIDEVGHASVMEICKAGQAQKKLVFDRDSR